MSRTSSTILRKLTLICDTVPSALTQQQINSIITINKRALVSGEEPATASCARPSVIEVGAPPVGAAKLASGSPREKE